MENTSHFTRIFGYHFYCHMSIKEQVSVIMIVVNIFLIFLLIFSYALKEVSVYTIFPSLCSVYIIINYWEKRLGKKSKNKK